MLEIESTELDEVKILHWKTKQDNRGLKLYTFSEKELSEAKIPFKCVEVAIYRIEFRN